MPSKKKINKGVIVLNKGERIAVFNLLSLIVLFLGFSIFRPMMNLTNKDRLAFHNLDSLLAVQEAAAREEKRLEAERQKMATQESGARKEQKKAKPFEKNRWDASGRKEKTVKDEVVADRAKPIPSITPMDINLADSNALVALPQIAEVMASRIHRYRNRLGGFVELEQLYEIKNMDSSRFETIKPYLFIGDEPIKKINVNTDEFKTLLRHPYLEYEQVKAIVNHRERKGQIKSWRQLSGIVGDVNPLLEHYVSY